MQGFWLGLALGETDAAYGKGVAALPMRQYLLLDLFAQHGTPSRLTDDAALGGKLRLTTEGGDGGGTLVAEGTPEEVAKNKNSFAGAFLKKLLK